MDFGYPRIPHLIGGRGTRDDLTLSDADVAAVLSSPVVVEEKLDGANVSIWWEHGSPQVALRGGSGTRDRGGQLGPLKAFLNVHQADLRSWFLDDRTLIAEWLWFEHSVRYDSLPSFLVGIDVVLPSGEWLTVDDRNREVARIDVASPPELFRGVPGSISGLERLIGTSRFGNQPMEGLIVRRHHGDPRVSKLVRDQFVRFDDEAFGRRRNDVSQRSTGDIEAAWDDAVADDREFRSLIERTTSDHRQTIEKMR